MSVASTGSLRRCITGGVIGSWRPAGARWRARRSAPGERELRRKVAELERALGRKTYELEIAGKALGTWQ